MPSVSWYVTRVLRKALNRPLSIWTFHPESLVVANKATQENPSPAVLPMTKDRAVVARGVLSRGLLDDSFISSNREASQHLLSHDLYRVPCCDITLRPWSAQACFIQSTLTVHSHRAETESWKGLRVNQDSNTLLHGPSIPWLWI